MPETLVAQLQVTGAVRLTAQHVQAPAGARVVVEGLGLRNFPRDF